MKDLPLPEDSEDLQRPDFDSGRNSPANVRKGFVVVMKENNNTFENMNTARPKTEEEINSPEFNPDDFAPAPENSVSGVQAEKSGNVHSSLIFAVMCTVFALIVAIVGTVTSLAGVTPEEKVRMGQVLDMYSNCTECRFVQTIDGGYDVYGALYKGKLAGYAVFATAKGQMGEISVLVGFDGDDRVKDVRIVSQNETPGLGDRITTEEFLSQFVSHTEEEPAEPQPIEGAEISCNAVIAKVSDIKNLGISLSAVASKLQVNTITAEEIREDEKNNQKDSTDRDTSGTGYSGPDTGTIDTKKLTGADKGNNTNNGGGNISVSGKDDTTVYETETKKGDDTSAPDETTAAAPSTDGPAATDAPVTAPAPTTTAPVTEPPHTDPPETPATTESDKPSETTSEPEETGEAVAGN